MITKPSLSVVPWADSGDRILPDSAYIASGFPRTNDKPTRQTMNWVLNYATNGVQYLTARGIPDWDNTQNYAAGDVVRSAGKFYSATSLANNINRTPAANPTFWSLWLVFQADLNALYLTPSQANAIYLPRSEVSATFATITNLNSIRDNLQQQINSIQTITGRGYLPGSGIAIDVGVDSSTIRNTSPNVQPDWNATTGGGAILNKPTYATVATSGSYTDLINRPTLATVATTGSYNSLTNLPNIPSPQVNSNWNAASGVAQILNKPSIAWDGTNITTGSPVFINNSANVQNLIIPATSSGSGYFQVQNNGQFGNVHPWMFSSTGQIQIRETSLYVQNGVSTNGDISTSTNLSCAGFWCSYIWLADIHLTNDGGWLRSSAGFATTSINISGIQLNNRGDGWLEVHAAVDFKSAGSFALWLSVGQGITANGDINTSANIGCNALSCGGLSWSNNGGWMYTPQGVWCANVNTGGITTNGLTCNGSATTGQLTVNGEIRADNNQVYAAGHRCRAGTGGGFLGNAFNITWDGSRPHIWIDNTDTGWVTTNPSDYRLKQNVEAIADALPLVMRLRPVTFKWLGYLADDHAIHAGFLAHEVQEVFAGAAEGIKDEVSSDGAIVPQRLNESDLIALLTRAVQELTERVLELEKHEMGNA